MIDLTGSDDEDEAQPRKQVHDLVSEQPCQSDECVEISDCDDEDEVQPIFCQPNSHAHRSVSNPTALRDVPQSTSSGIHRQAQANRSSADCITAVAQPAQQQKPATDVDLKPAQQRAPGSVAAATQLVTSFKPEHSPPAASTVAKPALPLLAARPSARVTQQRTAEHQASSPQPTNQQQVLLQSHWHRPPSLQAEHGVPPAVGSPTNQTQPPPPYLQDLHAKQTAAKSQSAAAHGIQHTAQSIQQAALPRSPSPMEQLARQVMQNQQTAQRPGGRLVTSGIC